jgi:hypothetical protein
MDDENLLCMTLLSGPLDAFRRFVQSSAFHPDIVVCDYAAPIHSPVMVLLMGWRAAEQIMLLEKLQLLAKNGASWKQFPLDFTYALHLCLMCMAENNQQPRDHKMALLQTIMGMPYASCVSLRMVLITDLPDDESADEHHWEYKITDFAHHSFWMTASKNIVSDVLDFFQFTPFDFEPYIADWYKGGSIHQLLEQAFKRWTPARAAWICVVVAKK